MSPEVCLGPSWGGSLSDELLSRTGLYEAEAGISKFALPTLSRILRGQPPVKSILGT